jgi:4-amino-4-deoxy-L-arabinose transferase-like glycosyltransferase
MPVLPTLIADSERARVVLLVALTLVMFFLNLGGGYLWDIDEGMHAATSKDMVMTGDWVTPTFNGEPFFDKPPLFNWFAALAYLVLGFTEFAARLPSALCGMGAVLLTYFFGRRMIGSGAAFLGAVALATSLEYFLMSRAVVHDMTLAFFVTLALFSFYRAYDDERRRTRSLMLFYVGIGFGILAKGPLGVVLPGVVIVPFLLLRRDLPFLRTMKLGWGALIVTAISLPWYLLAGLGHDSFFGTFILNQNLGYFLSSESRHAKPFHYYIRVVVVGLLPWSFYLLLAVARRIRRPMQSGPAYLFVLLWFLCGFAFFSVASSKLPTYVLPLFPAAALLVGRLWKELTDAPDRPLRVGVLCSQLAGVVLGLSAVFYLWFRVRLDPEIGPHLPLSLVYFVTAWILSSAAWTSFLAFRKSYRGLFRAQVVLAGLVLLFFTFVVAPGLNPFRSSKVAALEYDRLLPPGEEMVFYRWVRDSALFYTDRKAVALGSEEELLQFLGQDGALCMIEKRRLAELDNLAEIRRGSRVVYHHGNKIILEGRGDETQVPLDQETGVTP